MLPPNQRLQVITVIVFLNCQVIQTKEVTLQQIIFVNLDKAWNKWVQNTEHRLLFYEHWNNANPFTDANLRPKHSIKHYQV